MKAGSKVRFGVAWLLKRVPCIYTGLLDARKRVYRLMRERELRRLGYLVGPNNGSVVASSMTIDIVILSAEKDIDMLPHVVDYARRNVLHPLGNIYVVSPDSEYIRRICSKERCVFVWEDSLLPINKCNIDYRVGTLNRAGWIYQQLLKFSGDLFCSQKHFLVLDADTLLIRPQVFERRGRYIFNFSDEYHKPYRDIYKRLLGYPASCPVSFISHHMLWNVDELRALKAELELRNKTAWYVAILNAINKSENSGFSEYETYGQYVIKRMKESVYLEYWYNLSLPRQSIRTCDELSSKYAGKYKSISFHSYNASRQ